MQIINGEKMLKKILPILLALAVLLTACAPQAAPTMSPADVQNTAVAAAWTMVAATQAAIPTNTPIPPTPVPSPTPLPTFTPVPVVIPTLEQIAIASPTTAAGASDPNNCVKPLHISTAGYLHNVRIENESPGTANVSLNLYKPNAFGECGALSYQVKKGYKQVIQIPAGYWYVYTWVLDPPSTGEVSFFIGASKSKDMLRLVIKKDVVAWVGP
jgi:hypothetical protein